MPNQQTIPAFESLVDLTLSKTHLHELDREELEIELKQHLMDHYQELIENGLSHEFAVQQTIDQFGELKTIRKKINQTYPNTLREFILRELMIGIILLLAIIIGPLFLINEYRFVSMLEVVPIPFLVLLISLFFRHFILNKIMSWKIALVITSIIYLGLMYSQIYHYFGLPATVVMSQLSLFNVNNFVNGSVGLVTIHTMHLLWILVLLLQTFKDKTNTKVWKNMILSSFQYWGMIALGLLISITITSNSQGQIVFINIFFIASFLEQVYSDRLMTYISNLTKNTTSLD